MPIAMTQEQLAPRASRRDRVRRAGTIAGGTTQILLNQMAERVLGLPR